MEGCLGLYPWYSPNHLQSCGKKKVKCTLIQALRLCTGRMAHTGSRGIAILFLDHGTRRGWGVSITPQPLFTLGKTRYPLYRRLGGSQGWSGQVRKISPPPVFNPQTIQSVAICYTDYATQPTAVVVPFPYLLNGHHICTIHSNGPSVDVYGFCVLCLQEWDSSVCLFHCLLVH